MLVCIRKSFWLDIFLMTLFLILSHFPRKREQTIGSVSLFEYFRYHYSHAGKILLEFNGHFSEFYILKEVELKLHQRVKDEGLSIEGPIFW